MAYTLTITEEQKHLIVHALEKFSQYTLGQTITCQDTAKKLKLRINKLNKYNATIDLTK